MKKYLVLVYCALVAHGNAATWRPSDRLLHAVHRVESQHGLYTWGDNGQSLGDYQLSEAAWYDVNAWRKARGRPTYHYDQHVWNRKLNRTYAADYLTILQSELKKRLRRTPSEAEIYAAYNMGLTSFARCQYQLANVNPTTARKCQQVRELTASP